MRLSVYDEKHKAYIAHFEVDAVLPMCGEHCVPRDIKEEAVKAVEASEYGYHIWFPVKLARNDNWTRLYMYPKRQWLEVGGHRMPMAWSGMHDSEYYSERYDRMTNEGWDEVHVD
jgi:hypothetical protein